jgi:hypothetical protein
MPVQPARLHVLRCGQLRGPGGLPHPPQTRAYRLLHDHGCCAEAGQQKPAAAPLQVRPCARGI